MRISVESTGSFKNTERLLDNLQKGKMFDRLEGYAKQGVSALASATPVDSGLAASSWDYKIVRTRTSVSIVWTNSNNENGFPVAIMLQYGHGTGNGGYVRGIDYINPAIKPVMDQIAEAVWKAVTSA